MGCTVFGKRHLEFFFCHTLPSLQSAGNVPALSKERDVGMIIHTDKDGAEFFKHLNFSVLCDVDGSDKYDMIGRHQNFDLRLAKDSGADYHLLMPDFIYSENCFKGVLGASKKHKAITRLIVSTVQEDITSELMKPRSAIDLATLSLKHMHPRVKNWVAKKDGYPQGHVVAWEGKDMLHMCSPHQSPVYIANEAIVDFGSTKPLDCILDKIIDGPIYCPKPEDGIVIIEASPRDTIGQVDKTVDLKEFCRIFKWDTNDSLKQSKVFEEETIDAIDRSQLGDKWWNEVDISEQKRKIVDAIKEYS